MYKYTDRITVRFSKEEIATIEKAAKREKISPSAFVRKCVTSNYLNHPDQDAIMAIQHKIATSLQAALAQHLPEIQARKKKSA